jgi:hypothetical protein
MRKFACITLFAPPGGNRRRIRTLLETHQTRDFGIERLFLELDRFLAAAIEEQIGLDLHV